MVFSHFLIIIELTSSFNSYIVKKINNPTGYSTPRISVNPLCEYVYATATRRGSIIKNSKEKPTYMTVRYNHAEEILSFYLAQSTVDVKILTDQIYSLNTIKYKSDFEKRCATISAEALSAFLRKESYVKKILSLYKSFMTIEETKHKLIINGVQISIRPEIILRDTLGKQQLGFVKFYFSKSVPLTQERAELIACVGKHYFESEHHLPLLNKNCFVLDVFRGEIFSAPKSHVKRMNDIYASCQEIADRWHLL